MTRATSWFLFLIPLTAACATAPAPAPMATGPIQVEVSLAPADRALLETLLARGALGSPEALSTGAEERPFVRRAAPPRAARRVRNEGPILRASYSSGTPLYEGEQVQRAEGWERDGPWRAWHGNGQIWEHGAYRKGEEDGPWSWWYENGATQATGEFSVGLHVGEWVYYFENGQVMATGSYESDRPIGKWTTHAESGVVLSEGEYRAGERVGEWLFRRADGTVDPVLSGYYEAGERREN